MATRKRGSLSVVDPNAPAPKRTPTSITEALGGSGRDVLAAMRAKLAKQLDAGDISSNAISSSFKELRELDRLIRAADAADEMEAESRDRDHTRTRRSFDASAI